LMQPTAFCSSEDGNGMLLRDAVDGYCDWCHISGDGGDGD